MMELSQAVRIWPPIAPIKSSACKWSTIQKLDRIAAKVTHTSRPRTQLWDRSEIPTDKVMKRCYSSYQSHIIIPNEVEYMDEIPSVLSVKWSTQYPGRHWMVQDWVASLRQWGEFKVYIVDMVVVYIAVARWNTANAQWEYVLPERILPLNEIK